MYSATQMLVGTSACAGAIHTDAAVHSMCCSVCPHLAASALNASIKPAPAPRQVLQHRLHAQAACRQGMSKQATSPPGVKPVKGTSSCMHVCLLTCSSPCAASAAEQRQMHTPQFKHMCTSCKVNDARHTPPLVCCDNLHCMHRKRDAHQVPPSASRHA